LQDQNYRLQIINILGQIVLDTKVSQTNNKITASSFSKGLYVLKLSKNQNEVTKKLIIN